MQVYKYFLRIRGCLRLRLISLGLFNKRVNIFELDNWCWSFFSGTRWFSFCSADLLSETRRTWNPCYNISAGFSFWTNQSRVKDWVPSILVFFLASHVMNTEFTIGGSISLVDTKVCSFLLSGFITDEGKCFTTMENSFQEW
jgi:hypothetical protein